MTDHRSDTVAPYDVAHWRLIGDVSDRDLVAEYTTAGLTWFNVVPAWEQTTEDFLAAVDAGPG